MPGKGERGVRPSSIAERWNWSGIASTKVSVIVCGAVRPSGQAVSGGAAGGGGAAGFLAQPVAAITAAASAATGRAFIQNTL